jgi:hypothetical protein
MEQSSNVILSGDISFSYPYEKAALTKLANDKYKNLFKGRWKDWVLIFSR